MIQNFKNSVFPKDHGVNKGNKIKKQPKSKQNMEEKDEFEKKLLNFGLNQIKSNIFYFLLQGEKKTFEIYGKKKQHSKVSFFRIVKELNSLENEGWVRSRVKNFNKYYSVIDKKAFQKKLDLIISNSREKLQKQKEIYYSLVEIVKKFNKQNKKDKLDLEPIKDFKIPENSPKFIKNFLNKISENHTLTPFNSEINIVILLKTKNIAFSLNSLEIEMKSKKKTLFGGIIFCSIESKEFSQNLLEEIHTYNSNGLKFMYKLETKGYMENKTRGLSDFSFSDSIVNIEKKEMHTNFSLKTSNFSSKGVVETTIYSEKPLILGSLWAENDDFLNIIKKNISI